MSNEKKEQLVRYERVTPGYEAIYATDKDLVRLETTEGAKGGYLQIITDDSGGKIKQWSTWPMTKGSDDWDERIKHINKMQSKLAVLDEEIRQLRIHIGSFVACDSGFPVTVDELLKAIGDGKLAEQTFHNGCWMAAGTRTTQPRHIESMRVIYEVLTGYLSGKAKEGLIEEYPYAKNFISHTYERLGPVNKLTKIQKLLLERMLLPFDFYTKGSSAVPDSAWPDDAERACQATMKNCYEEGGRGAEIDAEIAAIEGLPKISMKYPDQARKENIDDPKKMDLYVLCCCLAHGLHTLSDCHHSTFRWIENWVYGIGTGKWSIPTRKAGIERQRLGHLLFGYALGLDKWLSDKPMQFILLDLGHIDLGFDPKNEILRVYAYLGKEKTPVKQWLAACLWHNLTYSWPAGLMCGDKYKELIEKAEEAKVSVNEWMELSH